MSIQEDSEIYRLLEHAKTIAVVGYSDKADRPSHYVAKFLMDAGYDVYSVNPTLASSTNEKIYASLADIPVPIDIVDIFRRSENIPPVVEEAIAVGAKAVWMQLGIVNEAAAAQAEQAGLQVVMDRCTKIEHAKMLRQKAASTP